MSEPALPNLIGDSPAIRYPSLVALQTAHNELLRRQRHEHDTPALHAAVLDFLHAGALSGALLDADPDRRTAQGLLDYWVARLYRVGEEPPDATLAEFDPALAPDLPDQLCPYLGLNAFQEADGDKFFGRTELIARLVEQLGNQRLLAVVGPSGSGKSSLVRAGLLPVLKRGALPGSQGWVYLPPIVPGSDPMMALRRVLRSNETKQPGDRELATSGLFVSPAACLLVVDQFEELFTLCDDDHIRRTFVATLRALIETPHVEHRLIVTMRSDFETFIARAPDLQARFNQSRVHVTPLSAAELREAIEQPAEAIGLKFQAGIVDSLLQDILGEPAGLPLLQFTLLKLWERREHNRVTREIYEQVGGGRLALARSADQCYASLIPEEQVTARRILLRMVRPGEGLEITSRRIRRAELYLGGEDAGRIDRVLARLISAHLVRLTAGETPDDSQIEVAHEALVRNWPTLVDWLEQEKTALAIRRRLDGRAAEWVRLGQASGGLLDAVELREAERWLSSAEATYLGYAPALPKLVQASKQAIASQARRTARLRFALVTASLLAAVLGIGLAIFAFQQRSVALNNEQVAQRNANIAATAEAQAQQDARLARTAEVQARGAETQARAQRNLAQAAQAETKSLADAGEALFELDHKPERALLLALASIPTDTTVYHPFVARAFYKTFQDAAIRRLLPGHTAAVRAIAWSPDNKEILTGSDDETARIWDITTGTTLHTFSGHLGKIRTAAWSPNGEDILIAGSDTMVHIWNIRTGKESQTLQGHTNWVSSVAWDKAGVRILTGSYDGTARIWDAQTGRELRSVQVPDSAIRAVAWSPDEARILTGSDDGIARIWDTVTGAEVRRLEGHTLVVSSVAWSPDGRQILTGSGDGTARIWDATTGDEQRILKGHLDWVWSVAWSPDGQQVVTGSFDGTARIWDTTTGSTIHIFSGHTAKIWALALSPNGKQLATGSDDQTVRIWDRMTGISVHRSPKNATKANAVLWSADGRQTATARADGTIQIWDTLTGAELRTLQADSVSVKSLGWSLDGRRIAAASDDGTVRIWDVDQGTVVRTLDQPIANVNSMAWSPNGSQIAIGSEDDDRMRICNTSTGAIARILEGYTAKATAVTWSTDGKQLLTGHDDGTARIWNASSGEMTHLLQGHTARIWSVWWNPKGNQVVTSSGDGTARTWDTETGAGLRTLRGHTAVVLGAVWSPDGHKIVTGSGDGTARIWDAETGAELRIFQGHSFAVSYVLWTPDSRQILTQSGDAEYIWLVSNELIIADISRRVCNLFTDQDIRSDIPSWPGCTAKMSALADDIKAYDELQAR